MDTTDEASFFVPKVDTSRPNIARVYDYWLGGKDNFAVDREEAERMLTIYPLMQQLARANRLFLTSAVTYLAEQGIRQFLDIGSGLPTAQNTHQVAQQVDLDCRVVYVDYDPVVVAHGRALLSGDTVAAVHGDVGDPASILTHPEVLKLIRPHEPVCLIAALILHFFAVGTARDIMAAFVHSIAPGSYVAMSVGSGDEETGGQLTREYTATTLYNHSPAQIAEFFAGLELVGPGLVDAGDWKPNLITAEPAHQGGRILAGVGRKQSTAACGSSQAMDSSSLYNDRA
jgi:hypothetical protein